MTRHRSAPVVAGVAAGAATAWAVRHGRSAAVRAWEPTSLAGGREGRLWCRSGGSGETGALLLHGLVATGAVFGRTADDLATDHVVCVPDLLGFGRSLDADADDFGTEAHLDALDDAVALTIGERPVVVGAHSMGSTLALRWARRHLDRVQRVVCIGAPMWPTSHEARRALGAGDLNARALLVDEAASEVLCRISCSHRTLSGWVAALAAPRWPLPIAREASQHTWAAYHQTLEEQILHDEWPQLLTALDAAGVEVALVWGDRDRLGDLAFARDVTLELPHASVVIVPGAGHTLPSAQPDVLTALLREATLVSADQQSDGRLGPRVIT